MEDLLGQLTRTLTNINRMFEATMTRVDTLERQVSELAKKPDATYSQTQVCAMTGWSKSVISKWIKTGQLATVLVGGSVRVPRSQVDMILESRGRGKNIDKKKETQLN